MIQTYSDSTTATVFKFQDVTRHIKDIVSIVNLVFLVTYKSTINKKQLVMQ